MNEALLLFFVYVGEIGLAALIYLAASITPQPELVFFSVYFLQFFFSIVQGGVSDHSCRKRSLIIAFSAILIGQIFFLFAFKYTWMIAVTVLIYGLLGNVTPISRAALVDTKFKRDFRLSVGLTTVAIALGWISMMYAAYCCHPFAVCLMVTAICLISILLSFLLKDRADLDKYCGPKKLLSGIRNDVRLLFSLLRHPWVAWAMLGYFMAEVAFYQVFSRGKADLSNPDVRFVITTWVMGYCFGVFLEKYLVPEKREKDGMISGAIISIIAMIALIAVSATQYDGLLVLILTNSSFAIGFGIFVPCLFSLISKEYALHAQGKIYGLIDSADSLALCLAVGIIYVAKELPITYLKVSSLIFIIIALYCFFMTIRRIDGRKFNR